MRYVYFHTHSPRRREERGESAIARHYDSHNAVYGGNNNREKKREGGKGERATTLSCHSITTSVHILCFIACR